MAMESRTSEICRTFGASIYSHEYRVKKVLKEKTYDYIGNKKNLCTLGAG